MNFEFTAEQQLLKSTVRQFVDAEIIPHIQQWDAEGGFDPGDLEETCGSRFHGCVCT